MSPTDVVLMPRWVYPDRAGQSGELIAQRSGLSRGRARAGGQNKVSGGVVYVNRKADNRDRWVVPSVIHPVIVDGLVIYRNDETVIARDLETGTAGEKRGQRGWRVFHLPMERKVSGYGNPTNLRMRDIGRHMLTVGGGKVFALHGFRPGMNRQIRWGRAPEKAEGDTSALAAISLSQNGKIVWTVGNGEGDNDIVRGCKYISAPTYADGKVYVMATYILEYKLICFDADTGKPLWEKTVCQAPTLQARSGYDLNYYLSVGTPPAVADGKVFAATNAGVIAAMDAETGQSIWAYQYDSDVNTGSIQPQQRDGGLVAKHANPILVTRGRVICMPADGQNVLALSTVDGTKVWETSTRRQLTLSAIDPSRILLSGNRLIVVRALDGAILHESADVNDVHGRPAITPDTVLASGIGLLYRMDLKTYKVTASNRVVDEGVLGNLVTSDGVLVAASSTGVCTYFGYDVAREMLGERIEKSKGATKLELVYRRARLAFGADRLEEAMEDFILASKLAKEQGNSSLAAQIRTRLYLTYVSLGNRTADRPATMRKMFRAALDLAETRQEKAHMMLRIAYALADEPAEAAAMAQTLAEEMGDQKIVDVKIGTEAAQGVRFDASSPTVQARTIAHNYIRRLIRKHGRKEVYSTFDTQAKEAFQKASRENDPNELVAVSRRWPHSVWADEGVYASAEILYKRARSGEDPNHTDTLFEESIRRLSGLLRREDSPKRVQATAALASIYARRKQWIAAEMTIKPVRDEPKDTPVRFGDIDTTLGEIIKRIDQQRNPSEANKPTPPQRLNREGTLARRFGIPHASAMIVRDADGGAMFLEGKLLVMKGNRLLAVDPSANSADESIGWLGLTAVDPDHVYGQMNQFRSPVKVVAAFGVEGRTLALADGTSVSGFRLQTAKRCWPALTMADQGLSQFVDCAAGGGKVVFCDTTGAVMAIDVHSGKKVWREQVVGGSRTAIRPVRVAGEYVFVPYDGGKRLNCFRLSDGRTLGRWRAESELDYAVTPGGIVLVLADGTLQAFDMGQPYRPLWSVEYGEQHKPSILAVDLTRAAISRQATSGSIEVLSLVNGKVTHEVSVGRVGGTWLVPSVARFGGNALYAVASFTRHGNRAARRRGALPPQAGSSSGLVVTKFDLSSTGGTEPTWTNTIDSEASYTYSVSDLAIGPHHVAFTAVSQASGGKCIAYVLRESTGATRKAIDLTGEADPSQRNMRVGVMAQAPVFMNGYLCLDSAEGFVVYHSR
ncbi:MAG: PQQ-binding-like beta-propeller repeat protein [Phycisphaerae bacterium]